MKKNILIIGINYYPEDSAIGLYTTQKAEYLARKGHHVEVITGFPYYPNWKISHEYLDKNYFHREEVNGVVVYRSRQYVPENPTFSKRILHLISFTLGNFFNLFKITKPDIVVSIIPFTSSALLGWFLKLRYKSKLWVHIQDFEFDAAVDSGLLKGNKKWIMKLLQWIETRILNKADVVSTISQSMIKKLKTKTKTNTYFLPNWIDDEIFSVHANEKHNFLNTKKFKILYSGNIGAKQDWGFFVKILEQLHTDDEIEIVVVGEGSEKSQLVEKTRKHNFVKHHNLVPFHDLPKLLQSADLHILFQKQEVIDTVMPSKILGMMASGKPSLVSGNIKSEVSKIFSSSNGGYYINSSTPETVIEKVQQLIKDEKLRIKMGRDAKKYVFENFSKSNILSDFEIRLLKD